MTHSGAGPIASIQDEATHDSDHDVEELYINYQTIDDVDPSPRGPGTLAIDRSAVARDEGEEHVPGNEMNNGGLR